MKRHFRRKTDMNNICRLTVRGYELDSFGHVNNSVYLQYAETAMWDCFSKHGLLSVMEEEDIYPVIMESSQRYMHELKLLENVRIETEMHCSGGVLKYRHNVYSDDTGRLSCRITGKLVYVTRRDRMITDIPDRLVRAMECDNNDNKKTK